MICLGTFWGDAIQTGSRCAQSCQRPGRIPAVYSLINCLDCLRDCQNEAMKHVNASNNADYNDAHLKLCRVISYTAGPLLCLC